MKPTYRTGQFAGPLAVAMKRCTKDIEAAQDHVLRCEGELQSAQQKAREPAERRERLEKRLEAERKALQAIDADLAAIATKRRGDAEALAAAIAAGEDKPAGRSPKIDQAEASAQSERATAVERIAAIERQIAAEEADLQRLQADVKDATQRLAAARFAVAQARFDMGLNSMANLAMELAGYAEEAGREAHLLHLLMGVYQDPERSALGVLENHPGGGGRKIAVVSAWSINEHVKRAEAKKAA